MLNSRFLTYHKVEIGSKLVLIGGASELSLKQGSGNLNSYLNKKSDSADETSFIGTEKLQMIAKTVMIA